MINLPEVQKKIKCLCVNRHREVDDFLLFAHNLIKLGVTRMSYDVVENAHYFYSKDTLLYHLPAQETHSAIDAKPFNIADSLNIDMLKTAIDAIDSYKLSVVEFHREIANAGVIYATVYLLQKKIYYLGQDAQYYLECYAS